MWRDRGSRSVRKKRAGSGEQLWERGHFNSSRGVSSIKGKGQSSQKGASERGETRSNKAHWTGKLNRGAAKGTCKWKIGKRTEVGSPIGQVSTKRGQQDIGIEREGKFMTEAN